MKTNLLKLKRAFSYVLFVLLTGILAIAKANPQSNNQILNETFESYTVGNKIATEANLAGNNWWTTWSEGPGSPEDGVVAEYGGTKCGYYTQGNDQVLILNENNDGIYNLEFDMLIPEGKKGYFNILHDFAGAQGSQWAFAAFINMDNNGNFTEGEGTFFIDGATLNQNVFVFDEWMHFRFNISTDNDLAHLYYSTETTYQEEQLLFYWQWSHDTNGNSCGKQLDAVNFYGGYSDVHFYIDNISLGLVASAFVVDGIKYLINDDGTSVTVKGLADGVNASGDLNIPATVTFNEIVYNVTKIADYAFDGEYGFSGTLTIPAYITNIGSRAFRDCSGFTTLNYNAINCSFGNSVFEDNQISTLNIGNGVEVIPSMGLSGLTGTLTIPNSVTSIDAEAFRGTGFNGTLTIPEGVTSIGRRAFNETGFTTINYNAINCVMGAQFDEWENTYTYECVFEWCQNLETLNIGENVQTISPSAFNVDGFTGDLVIPSSVTAIGANAFKETHFDGSLTIPENVTTIGRDAFYETGFTTINYNAIDCVMGEGVDWENNVSYECVFGHCYDLETLNIGENVQVISPKAFNVNGFTGNLVIPNSVTTIGDEAFSGTNFNGALTIPENITTIGRGAFYNTLFTTINYNAINCVLGESLDWENNVSYECVFNNCYYLETLNLGENVQIIPTRAFNVEGFSSTLVIPNSVTTIGDYAFSGTGFTGDLVIPNSVTTIGTSAFYNAGFNGALTIPENIATIGREAFRETGFITINYNAINCVMGEGVDWENNVSYECVFGWCQNLETLNIGENVQTISPSAFNVDGFTGDLVIPSSVTAIGANAFAETGFNGTMTMSNAVTSIGAYAFYNTQFSGTLTIPSSVTHIGSGAFYGTGFTTLNYNIPNYDEEITSSYDGPFSGMNSLTTLNIGNNVEVIPNYMFNITSLTGDLDIPNSVTIIGNYAFAETGFNGSLIIPNSVTYIGSNAFDATDFDGTLTIGNSVTSIGEHAFGGVGFTGNLVIPNSVQTIANGAFAGCGFDGTLTLGNSVTSIGEYAFGSVSFTGDLVIPNSVLTIGEEAFEGCEGFTGNLTIGNAVTSIGNSAFSNCYGFSGSLILGNSVETIGNRAFYGCGGFHGELTLPETVTYIGDGAFRSCDELTKVNYNATNCTYMGNSNSPVFYDCVSINQINIGANVENIPNYAFKRCSNVTAMNVAAGVPPTIYSSTFGTVSRSIPVSVPFGTREVYLTAPYWSEFINISDDYTPTQYDYHWTVNVNQFGGDMTIIGVIQINGVEQENPALEIGAFCGTECRGRQMLTYYSQIDRYQVLLMLYGEDGDVFSFRLYNHENEEELLLGSENEVTFVTNATLGLPLDPYVFNFVSKQTTTLNSGWSWYSTYIEQGGIDGLEMIENSLGEAGLMIQSRNNGYVEAFDYNNSVVWYGTLNAIENEQMYKVHTNASCNVVMTGVSATMSNHPITINSGWNWIGFPSGRNLNLNTALSGMTPEINDIIKGRNGYATYVSYNENNTWYGTLNVLESGQGYMYLSNSETPKTLVYQTGRDAELFNNITADGNIYKPVSERFADNMTITAIVDMDDVELKSESYEIAAFVGDECRGSVKLMYVEPFDRYVAFLTVFGEQSEEMRFVLTNNNDVFSSTEHISFINDGVVGTLTEPAIIHFGTMNLVDENNQTVSVYPNPTNGVFNVYCNGIKRIEVINTVGQLVKDMNVSDDSVAIDLSNEKAGVYMLRVITDNEIIVKRVIKE